MKLFYIVSAVCIFSIIHKCDACFHHRRKSRRPPPDTKPPEYLGEFKVCNSGLPKNYGLIEDVKPIKQFWQTPKAKDAESEPTTIDKPSIRNEFGDGSYELLYSAKDKAGNIRTCKIVFQVKVHTCDILPENPPRLYHNCPTNKEYLVLGTTCLYDCSAGYKLVGAPEKKCRQIGKQKAVKWIPEATPRCEEITCPVLSDPQHGRVICTAHNRYHSQCTYHCDEGYGLGSGQSTLICNNEQWSSTPVTACEDVQSPVFADCEIDPVIHQFFIAANESISVFNWSVPIAFDNTGVQPNVTEPSFPIPGIDAIAANYHTLVYTATDEAGNMGTCELLLIVSEINCDALPIRPGLQAYCSHGSRRGSFCQFLCSNGYYLEGKNYAICEMTEQNSKRGEWSNPYPHCRELVCDPAPDISNGILSFACDTRYASSCFYECNEGYEITNSVLRCTAQPGDQKAEWSGETPMCEVQTCKRPPIYEGMSVDNNTDCATSVDVPFNETCSYSCSDGYNLQGSSTNQCGPDGAWLESNPTCEVISCQSFPEPLNGRKYGCPFTTERFGTTCSFTCDVGFMAVNESNPILRTCAANENDKGYWEGGGIVTCTIVKCQPLVAPNNGAIVSCTGNDGLPTNVTYFQDYNTICVSSCDLGYTAQYSLNRRCREDGTWDGLNQLCKDQTDPRVDCPSNQVLHAGYNQLEATYQAEKWEPVQATDGGDNLTAELYSVNSQPVSGVIPSTLPEGKHAVEYRADDNAGNWGSCTFELDVRVTRCSPLFVPPNGQLTMGSGSGSCTSGAIYGSECLVSCLDGYILSDETDQSSFFTLVCNRSSETDALGQWSSSVPTCIRVDCDIPVVLNGAVTGCPVSARYGDVCNFRCNDGFQTSQGIKSINRVCQASATFDGSDFQCDVPITCNNLSAPAHGFVTPAMCTQAGVLYDTVCSFSCENGYILNGVYQKTCLTNGKYNDIRDVHCTDNQPPVFSSTCPTHRYINADQGRTYATIQDVQDLTPVASDNSGYAMVNLTSQLPHGNRFPESPTRLVYFAKDATENLATCDVIVYVTVFRCRRLQTPFHGSLMNCTASPIFGSSCYFSCDEGYELEGHQALTCELSGEHGPASWNGSEPICKAKTCPALDTPDHAVKSGCINNPPGEEIFGTQCEFYCLYGFDGVGNSTWKCQADETWSNDNFTCEATSCSAIQVPNGGKVTPAECVSDPVFGQSCVMSCTEPGYQLYPPHLSVLSCQGNGRWAPGLASSTTCRDVQSPLFSPSPRDLKFYAPREKIVAYVSWNLTATDNSGVEPNITCNLNQGIKGEGDYDVRCLAVDDAGNERPCAFDVEVQVHRCRSYLLPSYAQFDGPCDTIWGAKCNLTCDTGYRLTGSTTITCEFDGSTSFWSAQVAPKCEAIKCCPLVLSQSVNINPPMCTFPGGVNIRTRCAPYCPIGRSLNGDPSPIVCGDDGQWSGLKCNRSQEWQCLDLTKPTLTYCPPPISLTRTDVGSVEVTFTPPTATDSVDGNNLNILTSPPDLKSPYNVTGDATFSYTFIDSAGNSVTCSFPVYVQDELYPVLVSCPNNTVEYSGEKEKLVMWDPPQFYEPTGDPLDIVCTYDNGMAALAVDRDHLIECKATNTDNGKTTTCSFIISVRSIPCQPLRPPENGALACDGWSYGEFCSMLCNENYDIPRSNLHIPYQYVCGLSGTWSPHDIIPDCSQSRSGNRVNLPSELLYFSGSCGTNETDLEIAKAFLTLFLESEYASICTPDDNCTVENVHVTCGPTSSQTRKRESRVRRRIEEGTQFQNHFKEMQRERRSSPFQILIEFEVGVNLNISDDKTDYQAAIEAENKLIGLVETLIEDGQLNLNSSVDGLELVLDEASFEYDYVELTCEIPYTSNNDVYRCVLCGGGFFYDNETAECSQCPIGTFQDTQGQYTCQQCPEGQSTIEVGSRNMSQCLDKCQPGFSSGTGLAPCNKCPIGTYQEEFNATECITCPEGFTTITTGSNSSFACLEFCVAGEFSSSGFAPCQGCPIGSYQSSTRRASCQQCPGSTTTLQTRSTAASMCVDINECDSNPCQNNATCLDGVDSFACICQVGYTGNVCGDIILHCDSDPCLNGASCMDEFNTFTCSCSLGFTGTLCETEIDYCDQSPCLNNGTCTSLRGRFECLCPYGFDGKTCSKMIDYCADTPCMNGSTCLMTETSALGYKCLCADGYTGVQCSSLINYCRSSPCENGGLCNDVINGFTCSCTPGFRGTTCNVDIDLCANATCQNNGTCEDLGDRAICACPVEYTGALCDEVRTACSDAPCNNGGTCTAIGDTTFAFNCTCPQGYIGQVCEAKISLCQPDPCRNGASCIDQTSSFYCNCTTGYTGETCSEEIIWCDSNPCGSNATCIEDALTYRCLCDVGFTGERCDLPLTPCDDQDPCLNGATCSGDQHIFTCNCTPGYQGDRCEREINLCSSSPCLNGATCLKDQLSYRCECSSGYGGNNCEVDLNECTSNPCKHGGTCIDGADSFECECAAGYSGSTCSVDKLCEPNPCQNGGNCSNLNTRYRCDCANGFGGISCGIQIDYCRQSPCIPENTERCENGIGQFTCLCKSGFTGSVCENEINECTMSPSPCLNFGQCINQWGTFECRCQPGFTGRLCEIDVDDCLGHVCENEALCIDNINGYSCNCTEGTYGLFCQLKSTPCDINPCINGGVCHLHEDGFQCECLSGFAGSLCEVDIDNCVNHQCANGATCEDQWNSYSCRCLSGFTGHLCDGEIDDCISNPCLHEATCMDETSGFTCVCSQGFTGSRCESDILECLSNPCANLGTCIEGNGRFDCDCAEGYQGPTCKDLVSSCISDPCQNNATCTDGFLQYYCTCASGYTGDVCETAIPDNYDLHLTNQTSQINFPATLTDVYHNMTISLWIRAAMVSSDSQLFEVRMEHFCFRVQNACNLEFAQDGQDNLSTSLTVCDDEWHQIMLVVSDSSGWFALVDGVEIIGEGGDQSNYTLSGVFELNLGDKDLEQGGSIFMTGVNVWGGYVPDKVLSRITSECLPQLYGNVISWTDFDFHPAFSTASTTPSLCDDTDECLVLAPCQNGGTCMDELRSYTCICPKDYQGIHCEKFIELCGDHSCENGGSCITMNGTFHCSCPESFFGDFCELESIDGGWSDWLPWSPCSASCEGGIRKTSRSCTNPPPNQYGQPCYGNDTAEEPCNTEDCPGCLPLVSPANVNVDCWSEGDTKKCLVQCNSPSMGFVQPTDPETSCGPETNYKWSHESAYFRMATLPPCEETELPNALDVNALIAYPNAVCDSDEDKETFQETFISTYEYNAIACDGCVLANVQVHNCNSSRQRRSTNGPPTTVLFVVHFNNTNSNVTLAESLDTFDQTFDQLLVNGAFSLIIDGEVIPPDLNQSIRYVSVTCPPGSGMTVDNTCVYCPNGTFLYEVENLSGVVICAPCPFDTYQNQGGQAECVPCPSGLITNNAGSDDINDCIVPCPLGHYQEVWTDPSNTTCVPCPLNTYQSQIGLEGCFHCPTGYVTMEVGASNISDCVAVCNAGQYVNISDTANPMCPPCPINSYLDIDVHQEQECISCPQGTVTFETGSTNITDCKVVCMPGTFLESSSCTLCPLNTYQDEMNHREESCILCPRNLITVREGSESLDNCVDPMDPDGPIATEQRKNIIIAVVVSVIAVVGIAVAIHYLKRNNIKSSPPATHIPLCDIDGSADTSTFGVANNTQCGSSPGLFTSDEKI